MFPKFDSVVEVAEWQLCTGCGVCAYLQPDLIEIADDEHYGRRPRMKADGETQVGLEACPGIGLERRPQEFPVGVLKELEADWGPVLELWEGYASDEEIRLGGSSGGAATALALHSIETGGMHGVLHTVGDPSDPVRNTTQLSRNRTQLLGAMGSRYSPASPCEKLHLIESSPSPCMFIGKPCDVAAAQRASIMRPALGERLGLTLSIFCAGTPSTHGTRVLLRAMGVESGAELEDVKYRGPGWPGEAEVLVRGRGTGEEHKMSYQESWGILQRHRQWRCYVCADHTGEFADISVGDPWYRPIEPGEPGQSLVVVRTERGRRFLQSAMEAGVLTLTEVPATRLSDSQPGLAETQAAVWGRLAACRLVGLRVPSYAGFPLFRTWLSRLSMRKRAQSIFGTLKRVVTKRLYRRVGSGPVRP